MLRIALIGCGHIGTVHSYALGQLTRAGLVDAGITATYDPDHERAVQTARHHDATAHDSLEAALADVDVAWICTWTAGHAGAVRRRGRTATSRCSARSRWRRRSRSAATIADTLRGRPHQVGLVLRHAPVFAAFADAVASGRYGRPMAVVFRDDQYFPIQGMYGSTWRADVTKAGGGTLIEHSIHDLDVLQWILGPVTRGERRDRRDLRVPGDRGRRHAALRVRLRGDRDPHQRLAPGAQPAVDPAARAVLRGRHALDRGRLPRAGPRRDLGRARGGRGRPAGLDRPARTPRRCWRSRWPSTPTRASGSSTPWSRPGRAGDGTRATGHGRVRRRWTTALAAHEVVDAAYRSAGGGRGGHRGGRRAAGHGPRSGLALRDPARVREDCPMPLSEEELRILQEIEANLTATDPALVQQVSETTLYRHAARSIKWAIFGFVCGLVLLVATFTKVLVLGMVGFLVMLGVPARHRAQRPQARQGRHGQPHVIVP